MASVLSTVSVFQRCSDTGAVLAADLAACFLAAPPGMAVASTAPLTGTATTADFMSECSE